jgi:hypothetical protein
VQASLSTVFGRKSRHLSGTFCLTGDTMEGIIQCLVFLKAFSVSLGIHDNQQSASIVKRNPGKSDDLVKIYPSHQRKNLHMFANLFIHDCYKHKSLFWGAWLVGREREKIKSSSCVRNS